MGMQTGGQGISSRLIVLIHDEAHPDRVDAFPRVRLSPDMDSRLVSSTYDAKARA